MPELAPHIPLNDGHSIPQLGLGTWPMKDKEVAETIVTAVELGYRHIDTAAKYGNEKGVGRGIRDSGIAREELFVTTKLDGPYQGDDKALAGLEDSLSRLKLDYVDLLLIHWPLPKRGKFVSTFRTFKKLQDAGKVRSIGVSNFKPGHLDTLIDGTGLTPAVNQIQLDPTISRDAQRAYDTAHGIVTESWSPLGQGSDLLQNPALATIAAAHDRTAGQVVLRWHVQNGLVAIPKSSNPGRLAENLAVFDFELSADEVAAIATLSLGPDAGVDSDTTGH
jgi:2,5-diketo-D-gluconate reductase A